MGNVQPTRILCMGDSLTEGMSSPRPDGSDNPPHPYSNELHKHLSMHIAVKNAGHSGFTAAQVLEQLEKELKQVDTPYDIILIMAGTNDVLTREPQAIFDVLQKTWNLALGSGCKYVVALPILEVTFDVTMMKNQKELNRLILKHFESASSQASSPTDAERAEKGRLLCYDICSAFPQDALGDADTELYWSDPVHPTAEGYDRIAELIGGSFLEPLLTSEFKWTAGRDEALFKAFDEEKDRFIERVSKETGFAAADVKSRLAALGKLAR
ncbi:SGNH hydrolase-type esterase domain-containing protein [Protomyces lactucae-debilis]|uniref:SGNH hydrolase-type esterase domain-containing protein n=1 Tax=Protomyces lactucae-debilis TaxID=2754530 RepID=A0A1Y2F7G8_PROLT|nr:SGNH hydrolase-type esterase domain-containing protein [Protomyces lactucae-debilis]ORY79838.1 SGNH hydrolase-type esterase domain-containing protein [Protomyces lactucae-debilis]